MERIPLTGLTADAFQADTDRKALEALKKLPLLPQLVKKFYEVGLDRWMYCLYMATSVKCGPNQYPTLYNTLREACHTLDVPEPELFLTSNPFPNAFAGGVERPYIVLRSSIVETLDDKQLLHLMGHELGHIKCGHVLYFSVAQVLMPLLEMIGRRTFGLGDAAQMALVAAFLEWSRNAEISADRAGLLACQDFNVSAGTNLQLCAGPSRLSNEASLDAFLDQSRAYQDMSTMDGIGKMIVSFFFQIWNTHPMPVHRTQELERWVAAGDYDRLMDIYRVRQTPAPKKKRNG